MHTRRKRSQIHGLSKSTDRESINCLFELLATVPARKRRLLKELDQLNKMSATDDESSRIFIVDKTSDNDSSLINPQTSFVILGRILPTRGVFKEAAFQIKIEVAVEYPFKPPNLCFVTPIYHPNISAEGISYIMHRLQLSFLTFIIEKIY